tara:strand:+ start:10666 stop:11181 length:516 start_codon:yes stop_codon:yes gene_type:complete
MIVRRTPLTEPASTIPDIESGLSREEVVSRLEQLSKRGKLPGFERGGGGSDGPDASFAAHGTPFEGRVGVRVGPDRVRFALQMPRKWAVIFGVVLALTVWPGLPITDGFMHGFVWYERLTSGWFDTWVWYLPLTIIPAPFAVRTAVRRSRATAMEHATETVERLRPVLSDP